MLSMEPSGLCGLPGLRAEDDVIMLVG